jgi:hypothetical protein
MKCKKCGYEVRTNEGWCRECGTYNTEEGRDNQLCCDYGNALVELKQLRTQNEALQAEITKLKRVIFMQLEEAKAEQHHDYMSIVDDYAQLELRYNIRVKSHRKIAKMFVAKRKENEELRTRCEAAEAELQQEKDVRRYEAMLNWRDIYPEDGDVVCKDCQGSGYKGYGCTSTWRGGAGGQQVTADVCNKCWGSGVSNRPWTDLRRFDVKRIIELEKRVEEMEKENKILSNPVDLYERGRSEAFAECVEIVNQIAYITGGGYHYHVERPKVINAIKTKGGV